MKKNFSNIILILVFLIGLSLLLYPSVSDYWNSMHASRAVATYSEQVAELDEDKYAEIWEQANRYNRDLARRSSIDFPADENEQPVWDYEEQLNVGGNEIMGYIEIDSIDVALPVYHGTDENELQVGVGHVDWSSLPVGGASTHSVLSGHRGLPSAKLFTDIDKLEVGDTFVLRMLDEVLTYKVDQILIIDPDEISALEIEPGMDYCTLVTCTPYGINTHRLLVRGYRVETTVEAEKVRVTADAMQIEPVIVAPVIAAPLLLILLICLFVKPVNKKSAKKENAAEKTAKHKEKKHTRKPLKKTSPEKLEKYKKSKEKRLNKIKEKKVLQKKSSGKTNTHKPTRKELRREKFRQKRKEKMAKKKR